MSAPSLAALEPSASALIVSLDLDFALRERLFALGMRCGRTVRVMRRIGRDGPMQVRVDHTDMILRADQAERIRVEPLPAE